MTIINVTTLLDVPKLQEEWPSFSAVSMCDTEKITPEMEVKVRSNGEDIKIKIEEVDDENLVGKVLTERFAFQQQFEHLDFIRFKKKNVIDIYDIHGWGDLL